jgi:hypothetical protein
MKYKFNYIKNFRLFENNSLDLIEGELEDIVVHFCEYTNTSFKLKQVYCDGGIFIWEVDDSREIMSKPNYWDFFEAHKRMALEVGYHFHLVGPLNEYMVFSKYGDIKQTIIELLDWISGLELVETRSKYANGPVSRYFTGNKITYSYSYEDKKLIEWNKYIDLDGIESLDPRKASFSNEIESHYRSVVYLETFILCLILEDKSVMINILKSWLVEIDPLFKKFNLEISEHQQWT